MSNSDVSLCVLVATREFAAAIWIAAAFSRVPLDRIVRRSPEGWMKSVIASIVLSLCLCVSASAQLEQVIKEAGQAIEHRDTSGLSDNQIVSGLKQALRLSTS